MNPANHTGSVRLVDALTRVVEVLGPAPLGSRWPTDRELFWEPRATTPAEHVLGRPQPIGHCYQADGRRARFLIDKGPGGDALLDLLARYPEAPARLAQPYGPKGYLVEGR